MIGFESSVWLFLLLPVLVLWWVFTSYQRRALGWLETHVAPRFRTGFSIYSRRGLWLHMALLLVMGAALVFAGAGPFSSGKTEVLSATGRVLFLVDASSSMWAEDVEPVRADAPVPAGRSLRRIDVARDVAITLMSKLEGYRFALASFSGSTAIHLPMTGNRPLIEDALRTLEVHSYYRNTGSSIGSALDVVSHFADRRGYRLQVVLLSDGEQPRPEDWGAALAALTEQGLPVHSVAIGSVEGQGRRIFHFQDIVDKKETPRVLREYHTRRVDTELRRISERTGGSFFVAQSGVVDRLAEDVLRAGGEIEPFEHDAARTDLSARYLLVFLIGFLIDTLWFGRKPQPVRARFEIGRLGDARAWMLLSSVVLLLAACSLPFGLTRDSERGGPRSHAHRENERGIAEDHLARHEAARPHYERSLGYGIEPQIPAYNLARSVLLTGDYSEAHELFQEALLLDPKLSEAHFNDAMTLYAWGLAERDPKNCDLERTRELWTQALRRFSSAAASAASASANASGGSDIASRARANRLALATDLEEVEGLIADPPPECFSESEQAAGGGGGGGEGGEAGGGDGSGGGTENEGEGGGGAGGEPTRGEDGDGGSEGSEGEEPLGGNGGSGELSGAELDEIGQQLERLAEQRQEAGKYHRRTLPEQFRKEDWANPDETIWW